MSSPSMYALANLQQSNYVTLAVLTAVGYDYVLTFPDEVRYIWNEPWTWVSTLFILIRYLGLLNLITCSLLGSSFLPGPPKACEIVYMIDTWTYDIFLGAADLVMMLRVWAMYNRSRFILVVLFTLFLLEIIPSIIYAAVDSDPKNLFAPSIKIMDLSYCLVLPTPVWTNETAAFQITHSAAMCILAIFQFVRQLLCMHSATKQWHINQYMKLLVEQGIVYFFAVFLYNLMVMLAVAGEFPTGGWQLILSLIVEYVPIFTLIPRFILSIRDMHAHDVRRRRWTDSEFGLSSSGHCESGTIIQFADLKWNRGSEDETTQTV